jgi:Flp pilus assembly protein TadD
LALYLATLQNLRSLKAAAVRHIHSGQYLEAVGVMRQAVFVSPDADSHRLLAVAHLLAGQFESAWAALTVIAHHDC